MNQYAQYQGDQQDGWDPMPTNAKRKPLRRPQRQQINAALLKHFQHWQATGDEAPLAKAMGCKPWEIPVVHPDDPCPYPPGTAAYEQWPEAQARYLLLAKP